MGSAVLVIAVALAATVAIACASVRIVPAEHCGVVTRAGRVVRARPSGLALMIPGVERIKLVALHPRAIDPLTVIAVTRDGVEVRLTLSVLWGITDPRLAAHATPDPRTATSEVIERAVHHLVANVHLANLLRDRESLLSQLPVTVLPLTSPFGVELADVDLLYAEVRVGPELLRLLA